MRVEPERVRYCDQSEGVELSETTSAAMDLSGSGSAMSVSEAGGGGTDKEEQEPLSESSEL